MGRKLTALPMEERATLFSAAGRAAVAHHKANGRVLTGGENGKVIRYHPDGREEVIKVLDQEGR
jgi:hypothetical protein